MGGKPSKGTTPDKRLATNKPAKTIAVPAKPILTKPAKKGK